MEDLVELLESSTAMEGNAQPSFSPNSLSALYVCAHNLYRNGKYADAKAFFQLLTVADSFDRRHWMGLGACCQMMKLYQEAIDCYSAAAIQEPLDPHAHRHAADCFFHLGRLSEAKHALRSALTAAQENPKHHTLVPKLKLLAETWSRLPLGALHV